MLHELLYKDFSDIVGDSFPLLGSPSYRRESKEYVNTKILINFVKLNGLNKELIIRVSTEPWYTITIEHLARGDRVGSGRDHCELQNALPFQDISL